MSGPAPKRRATYQDVLDAPEHVVAEIAVHTQAERARIEPFEAIELDLAVLWANVPLPTKASEEAAYYGV